MTTFRDSHMLVTGAAGGIGRLIALGGAQGGARLTLLDRDIARLRLVQEELNLAGHEVAAYELDLCSRRAIREVAERILAERGAVDILVNNAGIVAGAPLLENTEEAIERTFQVNTLALFWMTRAFLPAMIAQGRGHVVTIASAGGLVGTAKLTDYCASKFAAVGFDESLRLELKRQGHAVRTTVVCPYYIDTGMFRGVKSRFACLLPLLKPDYVARRVLRAIETDQARLVMPRFLTLLPFVRILPPAPFDALMAFLGVTRSMDEFKGHGDG